jgi:aryl-alcohol dehydrogenase-like predicted oxidoreductase
MKSEKRMLTQLDHYRLLGRSGLRVSPLCFGTMTFGQAGGWGCTEDEAHAMLSAYTDRGGNFVDTANMYGAGESEAVLGRWLAGRRDSMVVSTKYSLARHPGDANAGGNHRKSMVRSVEESLSALGTDYLDLLFLHMWDFRTPVEEVLRAFDDLVSAGKVLYTALSDVPAWQASRLQAIADLRGWTPFAGFQMSYSLIERTPERDLIPMCREMGMGVLPWSPLGGGVLTGKYTRDSLNASGEEGLNSRESINRATGRLSERALTIAESVRAVADEIGATPAQVALAWTMRNPVVTAPVLGVRTMQQLEDNLGSLAVTFDEAQLAHLDEASRIELGFPHDMLASPMQKHVFGGVEVERR